MTDGLPTARGKWLVLLGQIVEPLVVRDNALQCTIGSICVRLAAMEAGDRPRRDNGVIDDWNDKDSQCLLAFRKGAEFGDDQSLDLVLGLWEFFHNTHHYRLSLH